MAQEKEQNSEREGSKKVKKQGMTYASHDLHSILILSVLIQEILIAHPISTRNSGKYKDDLEPDSILKDLFSKKLLRYYHGPDGGDTYN